jgi:hypothetical protein
LSKHVEVVLADGLEKPVSDFEELRNLAKAVRVFIEASPDKTIALKAVADACDVVFSQCRNGASRRPGNWRTGPNRAIADCRRVYPHGHRFQNREQATALQHAMMASSRGIL